MRPAGVNTSKTSGCSQRELLGADDLLLFFPRGLCCLLRSHRLGSDQRGYLKEAVCYSILPGSEQGLLALRGPFLGCSWCLGRIGEIIWCPERVGALGAVVPSRLCSVGTARVKGRNSKGAAVSGGVSGDPV